MINMFQSKISILLVKIHKFVNKNKISKLFSLAFYFDYIVQKHLNNLLQFFVALKTKQNIDPALPPTENCYN